MAAADFAGFLKRDIQGDFFPKPFYEPVTDSLILYVHDERSYAKQINDQFSLFLAVDDDSFVGVEFNGLAQFVKDAEVERDNYVPDPATEGMTFDEYMAWAVKNHEHREFEPGAFSNIAGNLLEIWWGDETPYVEWLSSFVSLTRGQYTKSVIGIQVHGIEHLLKT